MRRLLRVSETPWFSSSSLPQKWSSFGDGKPPTLAEHATRQLREAIIRGDLAPGSPLLLNDVAQSLDISIMPVREALKRLQYEGLVEQTPQKEARVAPLSLTDLDDTYAARILLETRAIRRSAEMFTEEDYVRLKEVMDQYEQAYQAGDDDGGRAAHKRFHLGMYSVGASAWQLRLIEMLWDHTERYRRLAINLRGTAKDRREEHLRILLACRDRRADQAVALLDEHLSRTAALVYQAVEAALNS